MFDVVIVGGGPAGLSAALMLGRCRRQTLVCDAGRPRNARTDAIHGFLTRDGITPREFLRLGRAELQAYGVEWREGLVTRIAGRANGFEVTLAGGPVVASRAVLLATGVVDVLPEIPGAEECYGRGLFHCPYCDGWEVRDQPLAAYGRGSRAVGLSLALKNWSADVMLLTDGPARLARHDRERLARNGVAIRHDRVVRFETEDGRLCRVRLQGGQAIDRRAIVFNTGQYQRSDLAAELGCEFNSRGAVKTDLVGRTCVPGVYVAGDASRDVQFVVVAAAEGAKVGYAINVALQRETTR